jgi:hypothetical protein
MTTTQAIRAASHLEVIRRSSTVIPSVSTSRLAVLYSFIVIRIHPRRWMRRAASRLQHELPVARNDVRGTPTGEPTNGRVAQLAEQLTLNSRVETRRISC